MAGLDPSNPHVPSELKLHQKAKELEISFADGEHFHLSYEFLRVFSPSAEVRGHGPGQETLQTGKRDVDITALEPVGNYGVKPVFSDGHDTGIYSWDILYDLGRHRDALWQAYLGRLDAAGASRDVDASRSAGDNTTGRGCGKKS